MKYTLSPFSTPNIFYRTSTRAPVSLPVNETFFRNLPAVRAVVSLVLHKPPPTTIFGLLSRAVLQTSLPPSILVLQGGSFRCGANTVFRHFWIGRFSLGARQLPLWSPCCVSEIVTFRTKPRVRDCDVCSTDHGSHFLGCWFSESFFLILSLSHRQRCSSAHKVLE